jgi:hypothetical protein
MIRLMAAILAAALGLSLQSVRAQEIAGTAFTVGEWRGGAYTRQGTTDQFNHCSMSGRYRSGISVFFWLARDYTWQIGWSHRDWKLAPGQQLEVVYWIDDFAPHRAVARARTETLVIADLPAQVGVFDQFRKGYTLRVTAQGNRYTFNLTDTYAALSTLLDCVARQTGTPPAPSTQVLTQPRQPTPDPLRPSNAPARASPAQRMEAMRVVANIMANAQMEGFRILSDAEVAALKVEDLSKADVVWRAEGVFGMLTVLPKGLITAIEDITAYLIAADHKSCKAQFASGSMPDERSAAVKRAFTACAGGNNNFNIRYIVVPLADGAHYVFATAVPDQDSQRRAARAEAALREAIFDVMSR